jgi:hypothetical protein
MAGVCRKHGLEARGNLNSIYETIVRTLNQKVSEISMDHMILHKLKMNPNAGKWHSLTLYQDCQERMKKNEYTVS